MTSKTRLSDGRDCEGSPDDSGDLRRVISAADAGDRRAQLAYEVFVYRIQTNVAAMCAAMGGIDGLVFTGGAGEASPRLRADVCAALGFLGIELESKPNELSAGDGVVSPRGAYVGRFGGRGSGGSRGCPSCARVA